MADKIYDLSKLEELAGGDQDFVLSMVDTFLEHTPVQLQELKQAHASGDLEKVGAISHKIKPNMDLFGLNQIYDDVKDLEQMGKNGEAGPEMDEKITRVDEVLNTAFDQLRELR